MRLNSYSCIPILLICLLTACLLLQSLPKRRNAPKLEAVTSEGDGSWACVFDGVNRHFILDLPKDSQSDALILALPGFGETDSHFRSAVHLEEKAIPNKYAVAYVCPASKPGAKFSSLGWNWQDSPDGNNDVSFLVCLANYLQETYSFDKDRLFVLGFSNGAFMTHRMAMEAASTFSAFVSVAGSMPDNLWETRADPLPHQTNFFQVTGSNDPVVPQERNGSKISSSPAIEEILAYYTKSNVFTPTEARQVGNGSILRKHKSNIQAAQVWELYVAEGTHTWPKEEHYGFDLREYIMDFLINSSNEK